MVDLTPPLIAFIRELRFGLRAGLSLNESLRECFARGRDEATAHFSELWQLRARGSLEAAQIQFSGHHARVLWDLLERADRGQPIDEPLGHLLSEVERVADADLERHISLLPFKALFPLLVLQFPAFATLLIGPLFRELQRHFIVLFLATASLNLWAEPLAAKYAKKMARADSVAAVRDLRKKYDAIRTARQACRIQLTENLVPYSCYEALELEGANKTSPTRIRLDQRCANASAEFRGLDSGIERHLSADCRKAVARARELRLYKSSDSERPSWPEP